MATVTDGPPTTQGSSRWRWAFLFLAILLTAALFRFWALGTAPAGLYRDEAYNGLDGLGVLEGNHRLYFPANNGREPLYIYLTALSIGVLGRTALAVRLAAAVVGVLTTLLVYRLGRLWFDRPVALLSAWLWAVTLWPVHLSRIGLRAILLPPVLTLTFILGTVAYRKKSGDRLWWMAAGIVYGFGAYTYLAFRFTPLLLLALAAYLLLRRGRTGIRDALLRLWPGAAFFAAGALLSTLPLLAAAAADPALLGLTRTGQVSVFNPAINNGDLPGTLLRHVGRSVGMFIWRGDDILRHNPAGRPVFDWLIAGPWLLGLAISLRRWRRAPYALLLLWQGVMLGPTILAEDAPHFLRAVGVLPVTLMVAAVGLSQLWRWSTLAGWVRWAVPVLLGASALLTVRDYHAYSVAPDSAFLFESAARTLANEINAEPQGAAIYVDRRYWDGWASIPFLVREHERVRLYRPEATDTLPRPVDVPGALYAWPYNATPFPSAALPDRASVTVDVGPDARGDLEPAPYPLYVRYGVTDAIAADPLLNFDNELLLYSAQLTTATPDTIAVALQWQATQQLLDTRRFFVHVSDAGGIVAQADFVPGQEFWPVTWRRSGLTVSERVTISLPAAFDPERHVVSMGLYDAITGDRVHIRAADGRDLGDSWILTNPAID